MTTPETYLCELVPLMRQFSVGSCDMAIGGSYARETVMRYPISRPAW